MGAPATEPDLVTRAQAGDQAAFGELVRLHQGRVQACAMQMLGSRAEADDAAQEAFIRAWRALSRFDGRAKLSTWLYRITVNVCLNRIRGNKRHKASDLGGEGVPEPAADPDQGGTNPHRNVERSQMYGRVGLALEDLSPSLRSAVVLVLLQGLSHREAGEVLDCAEGTVAWRIHEARRRLRVSLADLFESEPERAGGKA